MPPAKVLVSAIGVSVPFAAGEDSCAPCTETCERDYRARSIDRSGTAEATEHAIVIRDQAQRPSAATKIPTSLKLLKPSKATVPLLLMDAKPPNCHKPFNLE
jgi:hypothetical protein